MISILFQRSLKHTLRLACRLPIEQKKHLYFGYGGNLNPSQFSVRIPGAEFAAKATLTGYAIEFTMPCEYKEKGFASIREESGSTVYGIAYWLTPTQLALLDVLEWVPFGAYRRIKVSVRLEGSGELQNAYTYQARFPRQNLKPSKRYLELMISSGERHGFPKEYVEFLKSHSFAEKFELDHEFCLIAQGLTRKYPKFLLPVVRYHDRLREKLCELI